MPDDEVLDLREQQLADVIREIEEGKLDSLSRVLTRLRELYVDWVPAERRADSDR